MLGCSPTFSSRDMNMHLVFSAFTSRPVSLQTINKDKQVSFSKTGMPASDLDRDYRSQYILGVFTAGHYSSSLVIRYLRTQVPWISATSSGLLIATLRKRCCRHLHRQQSWKQHNSVRLETARTSIFSLWTSQLRILCDHSAQSKVFELRNPNTLVSYRESCVYYPSLTTILSPHLIPKCQHHVQIFLDC